MAVFGEAINNDGIQDAQVQVAGSKPDEFTTIATVEGATSASWLATFEPVKTTSVRLLVTRSGGPSTHTDVYEIEVFGRILPAAELKGYAAERLDGCTARWKAFLAEAEKLGLKADSPGAGLGGAATGVENQRQRLADQLSQWESLSDADRQTLVTQLERLEVRVQRVTAGLAHAAAVWPKRSEELAAARQAAKQAAGGENVVSAREGTRLRLTNNRVSVVLDEADGSWDATWLGGMDAVVRRVRFGVELDRQNLASEPAKAEAAPFTDAIGSGLELRQCWGTGVEVQRRIRIYHGKAAVVVAVQVTNGSDQDATLGSARVLDLSEENGGWWFLDSSPLAAGKDGTVRAERDVCFAAGPRRGRFLGASSPCRPAPDEEATAGTETHYGSSGVLALCPRDSKGGLAMGFLSALTGSPSVAAAVPSVRRGHGFGSDLVLGRAGFEARPDARVGPRLVVRRGQPLRRLGTVRRRRGGHGASAGPHRGQRPVVQLVSAADDDQRGDRAGACSDRRPAFQAVGTGRDPTGPRLAARRHLRRLGAQRAVSARAQVAVGAAPVAFWDEVGPVDCADPSGRHQPTVPRASGMDGPGPRRQAGAPGPVVLGAQSRDDRVGRG